ncbi:MAG: hypothetical protein JKY03_00215 [Aureispira sp.]|nr:hypothetical protein [Aureispira sp.]
MRRIKKILAFSFFASFLSLIVISCTNKETTETTTTTSTVKVDSSITDTLSSGTRTLKNNIAAKSYYYKNLATFEKGKTTFELEDLANMTNKEISLVVLYEANAPWAEVFKSGIFEITGDDQMNGLMESYDLEIIKQFAIDGSYEGIVMEPKSILQNPIEAAREVSMVDHVLMVHIKEVPIITNTNTADTEK